MMIRSLIVLMAAAAPTAAQPQMRNVILFMTDGLRWQEVFRGAEEGLMTKEAGGVENAHALKKEFCRETAEARREALMPFMWGVVAKQGQIYGNRDRGSDAHVTNTQWFSYPGYNETFCGFADPKIDSNKKIPNQNATVFEWLNGKPEYHGRVAAFGAWDVFPFIFNAERCGFPIDGSLEPVAFGTVTPAIAVVNRMRAETPLRWSGGHFDSMVFVPALEWFGANKPRVMFVGLGETDEWGHEGRYDEYLKAAHRADGYMRELWETCQSMPEYRGTTSLVITCDHGRGDNTAGPKDWNNHGAKHPGSDQMWVAVIGPDTPPLGERHDCAPVTQSQVAATMAALLGEDWNAVEKRAGAPIADAVRAASAPATGR